MSSVSTVPGALVVRDLRRDYGAHPAVAGVSFDIAGSEFVTLLGPSGSGKTTTLRMIAGFTAPTAGAIEIDGRDVTRLPPERREIGMVFQNYALFPHMTAAKNVAFPLEMRGLSRAEIATRVAEALALVRLDSLGNRYPRQLSGGQQQRVALARAIVFKPRLLLMDEPLGALDRHLREALQVEILAIRRRLGITVVYVTHDQDEALSMSDRIAVFNEGRIEQIGTARELYRSPASLFVATFLGETTLLRGRLEAEGERLWLVGRAGRALVGVRDAETGGLRAGDEATLAVRPDEARLDPADDATGDDPRSGVQATVEEVLYFGSTCKVLLRLRDGSRGIVREPAWENATRREPGALVRLSWERGHAMLVPTATRSAPSTGQLETLP